MIIVGYAGIGKSSLAKKEEKVIDFETLRYEWIYENEYIGLEDEQLKGRDDIRVRNPEFPENYIEELVKINEKDNIVLIPVNFKVLNELKNKKIEYSSCYPTLELKKEMLTRFEKRGNGKNYIKSMEDQFESMVEELSNASISYVITDKETYIETVLKNQKPEMFK